MNRQEAVQHILGLEGAVASEFYVYDHEREQGKAATHAALRALGVTDGELQHAFDAAFPTQPEPLIVMTPSEFRRKLLEVWEDGGVRGQFVENPYEEPSDTPPTGT